MLCVRKTQVQTCPEPLINKLTQWLSDWHRNKLEWEVLFTNCHHELRMKQAQLREGISRERRKERERVRNYEWTGTTLCLAVWSALLRALSRGCCSPTDETGELWVLSCFCLLVNYPFASCHKNSVLLFVDWHKCFIDTFRSDKFTD